MISNIMPFQTGNISFADETIASGGFSEATNLAGSQAFPIAGYLSYERRWRSGAGTGHKSRGAEDVQDDEVFTKHTRLINSY